MDMTSLIDWIVGESTSISDPAFMARCFVLLCILMLSSVVAHDLISLGK